MNGPRDWTVDGVGPNQFKMVRLQATSSSKSRRCNTCDEDFSNQAALGRHLKTKKHAERSGTEWAGAQWDCSICNKAFSRNSDRTRHEQNEHLGRKEPCPVCKLPIRPDYNTLAAHLQSKACSQARQPLRPNFGDVSNTSDDPIKQEIDQLVDSFTTVVRERFESIMQDSFAVPKDQPAYVNYLGLALRGKVDMLRIEKQVQADELDDFDPWFASNGLAWS